MMRQGRNDDRCTAGQRIEPRGCIRHGKHYWCRACKGYYGVPHDSNGVAACHTMAVLHPDMPTYTGPPALQFSSSNYCACRYCALVRKEGTQAAIDKYGEWRRR